MEQVRKTLEPKDAQVHSNESTLVRALNEADSRALDSYSPEKAAALFARFAANGTWQAPTLVVHRTGAFLDDSNFTNDPRLKYVRRDIRESWKNQDDFRLKNRSAESSAPKGVSKETELIGDASERVKMLPR